MVESLILKRALRKRTSGQHVAGQLPWHDIAVMLERGQQDALAYPMLEAGCDRAAAQLTNENEYRGETWKLPADAIAGTGEGRVTIEASRNNGQSTWAVNVLAEYPQGSATSVRRSRTFQFPFPTRRR